MTDDAMREEQRAEIGVAYETFRRNWKAEHAILQPMPEDAFTAGYLAATALERERAAKANEGMVSMPREPTEEMMVAGDEAILDGIRKAQIGAPYGLHPGHACWNVYRAMLKCCE